MRPEETQPVQMADRGATGAPPGIFPLVGGFVEVHVQADIVLQGMLMQLLQQFVGAPMQV